MLIKERMEWVPDRNLALVTGIISCRLQRAVRWSSRFSVRNMMHSFGVKSRNTEKNGV
jgi:hypothetical protein